MTGILLAIFGIYLAIGFAFGVCFAFLGGAKRIDPAASEGTWGFKLLIIPGAAIFWPLLARRWAGGVLPPEESSAHRDAAGSD